MENGVVSGRCAGWRWISPWTSDPRTPSSRSGPQGTPRNHCGRHTPAGNTAPQHLRTKSERQKETGPKGDWQTRRKQAKWTAEDLWGVQPGTERLEVGLRGDLGHQRERQLLHRPFGQVGLVQLSLVRHRQRGQGTPVRLRRILPAWDPPHDTPPRGNESDGVHRSPRGGWSGRPLLGLLEVRREGNASTAGRLFTLNVSTIHFGQGLAGEPWEGGSWNETQQ